ncbi:DUF4396 domain-containing protein [Aurantimonas sp. HBX-1]|uniref:DUF4396 domain-containing protein n=1 Tax=Aurantimonas sp. HBX-1 TaxID=2906072 RepID=UPI001F37F917|nr:DUF4396 domain-containing protein [Aurantimonas sp. HBX-1]UIJ71016.1 DUF4396 domain-containing protein [Aurantimonas sp. HBX-1]
MIPDWLHILSMLSLAAGFVCAGVIVVDEMLHPQHMWIMNIVWPATALFGSVLALWGYFAYGRLATKQRVQQAKQAGEEMPNKRLTPFPAMVGKGASHCGSGCAIGDICAEWAAFMFPAIAVWLGWQTLFPDKIFAVWVLDYILAFLFGVAFQYFTIKPMRGLSPGQGLIQAVKADTLSLTAWQFGMYGFMALAHFWIFASLLGTTLEVNSVEFWFMMQIAMLCGFVTSYPVNWWLISKGIKEKM